MSSPRSTFPSLVVLVSAGALLLQAARSGSTAGADGLVAFEPLEALVDEPIAPFRGRLLQLAFEAASAMPLEPHIKNRSRAQEAVVESCIELGQSKTAFQESERIANWRRGSALADLAYDTAKRGDPRTARALVERALAIPPTLQGDDAQDWHRDRIRAKAARTFLELGEVESAAAASEGIVDSERVWIEGAWARRAGPEQLDEQLAALEPLVATGNLDQVRGALAAYVQLFGSCLADAEACAKIEARIESAWARLPVQIRVETSGELARIALEQGDRGRALALADRALELVRSTTWTPEAECALLAAVAKLRARAGDSSGARELVDAALARFDREREKIVDIDRATALLRLAEARVALGELEAARALYARAVDEGRVNPNSRPRAEDLVAICASLARNAVEPDAELWKRLRESRAALAAPW